jgi:hypothetical protein
MRPMSNPRCNSKVNSTDFVECYDTATMALCVEFSVGSIILYVGGLLAKPNHNPSMVSRTVHPGEGHPIDEPRAHLLTGIWAITTKRTDFGLRSLWLNEFVHFVWAFFPLINLDVVSIYIAGLVKLRMVELGIMLQMESFASVSHHLFTKAVYWSAIHALLFLFVSLRVAPAIVAFCGSLSLTYVMRAYSTDYTHSREGWWDDIYIYWLTLIAIPVGIKFMIDKDRMRY